MTMRGLVAGVPAVLAALVVLGGCGRPDGSDALRTVDLAIPRVDPVPAPSELGHYRVSDLLAVSDIDGDGRDDIALATGDGVTVILGRHALAHRIGARGALHVGVPAAVGGLHELGDLDGDGYDELGIDTSAIPTASAYILFGARRGAPASRRMARIAIGAASRYGAVVALSALSHGRVLADALLDRPAPPNPCGPGHDGAFTQTQSLSAVIDAPRRGQTLDLTRGGPQIHRLRIPRPRAVITSLAGRGDQLVVDAEIRTTDSRRCGVAGSLTRAGSTAAFTTGTPARPADTVLASATLQPPGDFDGDGREDLVTAIGDRDGLTSRLRLHLGRDRTLQAPDPPPATRTLALSPIAATGFAGDLDGDGRDDLLVTTEAGHTVIFGAARADRRAPACRTLDRDREPPFNALPQSGDVDGDGHRDLVVARSDDTHQGVRVVFGPIRAAGRIRRPAIVARQVRRRDGLLAPTSRPPVRLCADTTVRRPRWP